MKLLKGSLVLKISSLIVAIATYFYIHHVIDVSERKNSSDSSYRLLKLTAKNLPVKVRLETQPPDGYRVLEDRVLVMPSKVLVVGPEALLDGAMSAETSIVDISESTKTVTKKIHLESVSGIHLTGEPQVIEVTVPIEKIPVEQK